MKRAAALAVVIIGLAGCADAGTSDGATTSPPSSTEASSAPTSTSAASTTVTEARPIAPDFVLGLGNGETFVLSEEARPVYLVFWAEW
jgi:hypothetical protein